MNAEQLRDWLKRNLPRQSTDFEVKYVLNWGGFVNHSYTVTDGAGRYHLKLTNDRGILPDAARYRACASLAGLQTWRSLHRILERRYRTPAMIDWLDLSEIGFSGLMLRHVEGGTADLPSKPDIIPPLIEMATRLHQDDEIRRYFAVTSPPRTRFDHFVATYMARFTGDMECIAADPPPFISPAMLHWMADQTNRLAEAANRIPSFHLPAAEPVHGDLHQGNVLVSDNEWFIVDWDDLGLGDPALEFAILLWPLIYRAGRRWQEFLDTDADSGFGERMEICLRAQLLDEVIDVVADYVQASVVPSDQDRVRQIKKQQHQEALERYLGYSTGSIRRIVPSGFVPPDCNSVAT